MTETVLAIGARLGRWPRSLVTAVALLLVVAMASSLPTGGPWGAVTVLFGAVLVAVIGRYIARPEDRVFIAIAIVAFLARAAIVAGLDIALVSLDRSRTLSPDERIYVDLAARIAAYWHDPSLPFDHSDTFISSQYVQSIARVFFFTGPNLLVVKVLNTLIEVVASLLIYRIVVNLGLGRPRLALLLMLVFPSLVAWSALGLKDSYVLFVEVLAFWTMSEYIRTLDARWHFATAAAFVPIMSVRLYVFVILVTAWLGIIVAVSARARLRTAAFVVPLVAVLFWVSNPLGSLGGVNTNLPYIPVLIREYAGLGRSSFVAPVPVARGDPGDRVVISVPGETAPPGQTPRVIVVQPGTELTLQVGATPPPSPDRANVVVRPGDIVVFAGTASPAPSPSPGASPTPVPSLTIVTGIPNVVGSKQQHEEESSSPGASALADLRQLPIGILFTLAAPFPWTASTMADLAAIPEMLLWYVCLVLAVFGLVVMARARRLEFAPGVLALAALTFIFALIQGNVGTLVRSRAMLIPLVIVLAAVGADYTWSRWGARVTRALPALVRRVRL